METIKELSDSIDLIDHERLLIFCLTLIIIFSLIWMNNYTFTIILLCFSMILHFSFISFYYYKTQYHDSKGKIITHSEYRLPKKNEKIHRPLKFIKNISIALLIFSAVSFIVESYLLFH